MPCFNKGPLTCSNSFFNDAEFDEMKSSSSCSNDTSILLKRLKDMHIIKHQKNDRSTSNNSSLIANITTLNPSVQHEYELPLCVSYLSLVLPSFSTPISKKGSKYVSGDETVSTFLTEDGEDDATVSGLGFSDVMSSSTCGQTSLAEDRVKETIYSAGNVPIRSERIKIEDNYKVPTMIQNNFDFAIEDSKSYLWETASLGNQYIQSRQYEQAIILYSTMLKIYREKYGQYHALVISTIHNLCVTNIWSGNYDKALLFCREALKLGRKASLSDLGIIYYAKCDFSRSLIAFREALQIFCKDLGYDHPSVARILNNIGCVYFSSGKLIAATATLEESFDIQRNYMGSVNGDKADNILLNSSITLTNSGIVSMRRQNIDLAVSFLEEGLMVQESVLDGQHRIVMGTSDVLQSLLNGNRAYPLKIKKKRLEIKISTSVQNLSRKSLVHRRKFDKVEYFSDDGTPLSQNSRDDDSSRTPERSLSAAVHSQPFHIDFLSLGPLQNKCNARQRVVNGHMSLMQFLRINARQFLSFKLDRDIEVNSNQGLFLNETFNEAAQKVKLNRLKESKLLFQTVLKFLNEHCGSQLIGKTHYDIGLIYFYAGQYEIALSHFDQAINTRTSLLENDHPVVLNTIFKKATTMLAMGDFENSLVIMSQVLRSKRKNLGYNHPEVATVLNTMGVLHYELGGNVAAKKIIRRIFRNSTKGKSSFKYSRRDGIISIIDSNSK